VLKSPPPIKVRELPIVLTGQIIWVAAGIIGLISQHPLVWKSSVIGFLLGLYGMYRAKKH
jgi:hypothetical protein